MASNGRLPASDLAPIPGGHLQRTAALYWNALCAEARQRYGITPVPTGPMSSYRTYAQQLYLYGLYRSGRGNLAAYPGSSNHGLGLAVDLASQKMRWIIDQIGRKYGFSKACSDAQSEWWHIKFNPSCTRASWRPDTKPKPLPVLRRGIHGHVATIKRLQTVLRHRGHKGVKVTGKYDLATRRAIRKIQRKYHLPVDGVCGPRTWHVVLHRR